MTTTNNQAAQSVTSTNQTKTTKEMVSMKQLTMTNVNGVGTDKVVAVQVRLANETKAAVVVFGYSPYGGRRTYLSKEVEGKRVRERMTVPAFVTLVQPHLAQADLSKLRHTVNGLKPIFTRNFITCLCMNCGAQVSAAEMDYIQRNADALGINDFTALCMKCQPQRKTTVVPAPVKTTVKAPTKPQAPKAEVKPEAKAEAYIPTVQDMINAKDVIGTLKKNAAAAPKRIRGEISRSTTMSAVVSMLESVYDMCNMAFADKSRGVKEKLISRVQDNIEVIMDDLAQMNIMPYGRKLNERTTFKSAKAKAEHYAVSAEIQAEVTDMPESIQSVSESSDNALEKTEEMIQAVSDEALVKQGGADMDGDELFVEEFECDICTLVKPLVYNKSLNHHVCQGCSDAHDVSHLFNPEPDAVEHNVDVDVSSEFLCATPECLSLPMRGSSLCPSCTHENIMRNLRDAINKG
jgi:hypothetical protein